MVLIEHTRGTVGLGTLWVGLATTMKTPRAGEIEEDVPYHFHL